MCKVCNRIYQRSHYKLNTQAYKDKARKYEEAYEVSVMPLVLAYLKVHPCIDCGNADIRVLHFDHRDPALKEQDIAQALHNCWAWERLSIEIAKCDVRCSNCHMIRTAEQYGWWRHFAI